MRTVTWLAPGPGWRRLGLAILLAAAGCATLTASNRTIPIVPGFPLETPVIQVDAGDQVTWVNGDPARGKIRVDLEPGPGVPPLVPIEGTATSFAGYNARFTAPGTYRYTISATTGTGVPLVPRTGEVVVRERATATATPPAGAAPPVPPTAGAAPPPPLPAPPAPPPAGTPPRTAPPAPPPPAPPADVAPVGRDIARVKTASDVYTAYRYRREDGVVLKLEGAGAEPATLRPGSDVNLRVTYTVLAPGDAKPVGVKEQVVIRYGPQDLRRLRKEVTVSPGTYTSQYRVSVPADAAEGPYTVLAHIEITGVAGARGEVASTFTVVPP
jgi:hypothetical protein